VPDFLIFSPPPNRSTLATTSDGHGGALHVPVRGVAIEMKRRSGKDRATKEQIQWIDRLQECGWIAIVCYGAEVAARELRALGYGQKRDIVDIDSDALDL
jgi:hypothetical protein